MQRFRGGLVFKAHEPLYHSTLGLSEIKRKKIGPSGNREPRPKRSPPQVGQHMSIGMTHLGLYQKPIYIDIGGRCKNTWKREFKLPWREAGPPNHLDDGVDSD